MSIIAFMIPIITVMMNLIFTGGINYMPAFIHEDQSVSTVQDNLLISRPDYLLHPDPLLKIFRVPIHVVCPSCKLSGEAGAISFHVLRFLIKYY